MIDMEKKQLNFSAPLLSTRRYSSPLRSSVEEPRNSPLTERRNTFPPRNPDVKLGEVVKPGSVPFMWEQIPGKAKSGSSSQVHSPDEPATTPRLPPGRLSGVKSGELGFFRPQNRFSGELNLSRPQHKLSGEMNVIKLPAKFLSGEIAVVRAQNRLPLLHKADDSGSDADDAAFSDAIDALESYSMNCSTSGLSSSEVSITKPSVDSLTDSGNRDFMMNRFLPAAKAMTLDSPQYASKRQIVAVEQPQLSKLIVPKIVKGPRTSAVEQSRAPEKCMAITLYNGQDIRSEASEEEQEKGRSNEPRTISVRSCGFFPWFCSKNALRLLNPVPAMKVKTKSALASASKVGRLVKNASYKSPSRTNSKHKVNPVTKSCELNRVETKPNIKSRPMFYSGELPSRSGESQGRSLSPYRNYRRSTVSPHSPFNNGVGYPIVPKTVDHPDRSSNTSGPISFNRRKTQGSRPESPATEKTLYVDSANTVRSRHSSGRMDIVKARGVAKPPEAHLDQTLSRIMNQSFRSSNFQSKEIIPRSESPLPPPLPKSPTESWLSRNLNSVSPRNSVSHTHAGAKWETIVKSSNLRCDHGRFSEELVARVPQKSRTRK